MRLYTENHIRLLAGVCVLAGMLLALAAGGIGAYLAGDRAAVAGPAGLEQSGVASGEGASATPDSLISSATTPPDSVLYADEAENIAIYERLNHGVVNITTETLSYTWFLEPVPREGSSGSGSIIDDRGYILTNHHVVKDAYRVFITLADGDQVMGEVVGVDPENDLAVLRFDPGSRELTVIPMGSSEDLRVGQRALAIGNPFALDRTLTVGIISGLGRPIRAQGNLVIRDMIQTDASINPGNSGGPLLDSRGRMIGINTAIFSQSGGSIGIGFAVPVATARRVVPDLIEYGVVRRGWIDIVPVQLFPQLVRAAGLPVQEGLLVNRVIAGGLAEAAGLRGGSGANAVRYGSSIIRLGGDIITEVDGIRIRSLANLYEALEDTSPGDTVEVVYVRGRREHRVQVELSERPEQFQWS
ncbi:S1C family serine protease [Spirochaeta africana]|uniref:Trypsin-like serine protease with C-terminal PDZ domain n=1 Tax=Spirochaeta africana (strain ATCC 700263 / DSM 8902 / Z-7692) TaxID=889378 RepID=H9UGP1_SPIAZ|nr:trypsin-like peptidase domain-containing protein [Spirochaeta africana]AFG36684.1 trypsin-like serine protease with C-terminal PDZ domain [Spirochaeta africana DSM 8902]